MKGTLLNAGIESRNVADVLAAVMRASIRPATEVLERLGGCTLSIKVLAASERHLTDGEQDRLSAYGIVSCSCRTALLVTGDGTVAAGTFLLWLPARLPYDACRALKEGTEPAGRILAPLGMRRADRRALATTGMEEITGAGAAVRSSAVLVVGGVAAGIAEENICRDFAESLALGWCAPDAPVG